MDTNSLVENQIDDGQRLIDQLVRDDFQVSVAFWILTSEEGQWQLCLASPQVDPDRMADAYRRVYASLRTLGASWVNASDLKLLNGANQLAQAAIAIRDRYPGRVPTRFNGKRLGSIAIEAAYIYPQAERWFPGFDDIKRAFPNAAMLTVPILYEDARQLKLDEFIGRINASVFEGRAPETVMFVGFSGSSGKRLGELVFIYRPEGWNTLYRADTQKYEPVRHVETGKPIYASLDFGPLQSLKTSEKPGDDQIQKIKELLAKGYFITVGAESIPIRSIPFTPPPGASVSCEVARDWESVRTFIQSGGTINVHEPKKEIQKVES